MWNYMNFGVAGQIAVATSETPLGPFVVVNTALNITRGSSGKFCSVSVVSFEMLELFPFLFILFAIVSNVYCSNSVLTILRRD